MATSGKSAIAPKEKILSMTMTKTIQNINVWKRKKPELEPEPCYEKGKLRSRRYTHESKSTGAGAEAIIMKRKAPEPQ